MKGWKGNFNAHKFLKEEVNESPYDECYELTGKVNYVKECTSQGVLMALNQILKWSV